MRISTSRIVAAGAAGAVLGLLIALALSASGNVALLLALAGFSIAATLVQAPSASREPQPRLASARPARRARARLAAPLGSGSDRYWDGDWTRHVWHRAR